MSYFFSQPTQSTYLHVGVVGRRGGARLFRRPSVPLVGGVDFTHFHFFLLLLFNRVKAFGDVKRSFRRHRSRFLFFRHNLESVVLDAILRYEDRIRL